MSCSSSPSSVSAATTPSAVTPPQEWRKDNILISTSHSLLDISAINDAFASPELPWAKRMQPERLEKMLSLSMCFGVYEIPPPPSSSSSTSASTPVSPSSSSSSAAAAAHTKGQTPKQIGLARLVTDTTTFAYLTDVYILPLHQHRGLATLLMSCVHSTVTAWPDLRRLCLFSESVEARTFYRNTLGMQSFLLGKNRDDGADGREEGMEYLMMPQTKDMGGYEFLTTATATATPSVAAEEEDEEQEEEEEEKS